MGQEPKKTKKVEMDAKKQKMEELAEWWKMLVSLPTEMEPKKIKEVDATKTKELQQKKQKMEELAEWWKMLVSLPAAFDSYN